MMKCIVCERPDALRMTSVEVPAHGPNEALVKIRRIGVCGTDLHAYKGRQPYFTYPRVLGHELSGEVMAIGENEAGLKTGDRVVILPYLSCGNCVACRSGKTNCCTRMQVLGVHQDGGMREVMPVPVACLLRADSLTLDQAALVEPFSIGAHAVGRSQLKRGETALVIGAGPIGLGVMKFAKLTGARVLAMDINEDRLQFCQAWGGVDDAMVANDESIRALERLTDGDYPDVVFDATGNTQSMNHSFQYVAHGGRLIFVGLVKDDISFYDPDFHQKEISLLSSRNAKRDDFEVVIHAMKQGMIDTDAYITHRAAFDSVVETFPSWLDPEKGVIKAMITLS